jgi:hypothetical protein
MKTEIEITLTPDMLAEMYIRWDNEEQADFLNLVGEHFRKCDFDAELQCCYLSKHINKHGRDFIYTVANFHKARGIPCGSPKERVLLNSYNGESLNMEEP